MPSEEKVPLRERALILQGFVSDSSLALIRSGLPAQWPQTARCLFVSYAYADLPLGKRFDFVFPWGAPGRAETTDAIIHAATQQFGKPFDEIPSGWKSICVIDFPRGVPPLVERLPVASSWGDLTTSVSLCEFAALQALREAHPDVKPNLIS